MDHFEDRVIHLLRAIEHHLRRCCRPHRHVFGEIFAINQQGKIDVMATNVTVGWTLPLTAKFFNATDGKVYPLAPGTVPVWSAGSTTNVTLTPSTDGMTCDALAIGAGDVIVTVIGQGDPVPGVDDITATIDILVQNPEDNSGTITAGAPVPPAAPAPAPVPTP